LRQQYGKLKSDVVYIRRGDTTGTAKPDEIAGMGEAAISERSEPVLEFEFADLDHHEELGKCIGLRSTVVLAPERKEIPLYGENSTYDWFDTGHRNRNYYRDVAAYIRDKQ